MSQRSGVAAPAMSEPAPEVSEAPIAEPVEAASSDAYGEDIPF